MQANLPKIIQQNSFASFLGKLPLFMYLFHGIIMKAFAVWFPEWRWDVQPQTTGFYFSILALSTTLAALFTWPIEKSSWYLNYVFTNKTFVIKKSRLKRLTIFAN